MSPEATFIQLVSTLAGFVLGGLVLLILFLEFRDLFLSRRIRATVIRINESPSTDADGHDTIDRFPEIQFMDPSGKLITHKLVLTNMTWKEPGDKMIIYYRPAKNEAGYKICSPFMWPKLLLLVFLTIGASLLLFGPGS